MDDFKQKILADLEPGQTVIFDGREWWFAGVLDGKARLWPKEGFDMTWEQVLALNKKLRDSPDGEFTYMEFKAILEGKDLDIDPEGKPYESSAVFFLSHDVQSPELKVPPHIPGAKWWVRSPKLDQWPMEGPSWYQEAREKFQAGIVGKMQRGKAYLYQLYTTCFLEFDTPEEAKVCYEWAEENVLYFGYDPVSIIDTSNPADVKRWRNFLEDEAVKEASHD